MVPVEERALSQVTLVVRWSNSACACKALVCDFFMSILQGIDVTARAAREKWLGVLCVVQQVVREKSALCSLKAASAAVKPDTLIG